VLKRLTRVFKFLRGELIVLEVSEDKLVVDAGNAEKDQLREVASVFFTQVYSLN
jgi:hypothetical protein